jgi:cyclopropane fatty-acyl-phospholipid synthase-like methyltransferase
MSDYVYDAIRYSNFPYGQTHPDRLATVAILYGLHPPDPFTARVLELGCGAGGNLIAMAASVPGIRALGVDLAVGPVADGNRVIAEIGLPNVELRHGDVRELEGLGEFDYIVAHGLYSWVPPDAQDALMDSIHRFLAPGGIAYVSYNAQPGGYMRGILRDAGLWHARHVDPADEGARATKARELYAFLDEHRVTTADTWGAVLGREVPPLAKAPIYKLVHDDLSEHFSNTWFADFAAHAARHGLGYVGEADLYGLRTEMLPDDVGPQLWELAGGDRIAYENYSDLLTARHFRQSVLCHAAHAPAGMEPVPALTERLHWAALADAEPLEIGLLADAYAELARRGGGTLGFEELRARLDADPAELAASLLDGFRRERLMPHAGPLTPPAVPAEHPVASPLARWQAAHGESLTSLVYRIVRMEEPAARTLITLLDGTRDRAAIRADLRRRTGLELSEADLESNLAELAKLFLLQS